MKILNKPIKVMAVFHTDGKIEPVKFRIEDKVINVDRVIKSYEERIVVFYASKIYIEMQPKSA